MRKYCLKCGGTKSNCEAKDYSLCSGCGQSTYTEQESFFKCTIACFIIVVAAGALFTILGAWRVVAWAFNIPKS